MSVDFARSGTALEDPNRGVLAVSRVLVRTRVRLVARASFCWCDASLVAHAGTETE
jgi:hypothetical protein